MGLGFIFVRLQLIADKYLLFAPFPRLARLLLSQGALKTELLITVRNIGEFSRG